jgi:hypothetical protein
MKRTLLVGLFASLVCACGDDAPVQCQSSSECNVHPEGVCLTEPTTGHMWCAYEGVFGDGCASGTRWAEEAGDGLANTCVDESIPDGGMPDGPMPDGNMNIDAGADAMPPGPDAGAGDPFASHFGGTGNDTANALALDGSDNIALTGGFEGTVDFGGGAQTSAGLRDIFLAQYSGSTGSQLWSKRFGASGNDQGMSAVVDASGNIVVVGNFEGGVDFGGGTLTSAGGTDIFVAKFTSGGAFVWAKRFGTANPDFADGVAVDSSGNVIVLGRFTGTINFGGADLVGASVDFDDIALAKLATADGAHMWSKRFGSTAADSGSDVTVDSAGNVLITGIFRGTVDFGGGGLVSGGDADIFVAKYVGANGNHVWSKRFGSTGLDGGQAIVTDSTNDVFVTGSFIGSVDFGGGALMSTNTVSDIFLVKLAGADGAHVWSDSYGGTGADVAFELASDLAGNVLVTGRFSNTVDFGGVSLTSAGGADIFVARYAGATGAHLDSKRLGGTGDDFGNAIAVDSAGNTVLAGQFTGTVDFGSGVFTTAGGNDIYLVRMAP